MLASPFRSSLPLAATLFALCFSAQSWADTVLLKNGDRLSGTVQLLDANTLVLKTSYAGELRIDWTQVARLDTDQPLRIQAAGVPQGYHAALSQADSDGLVRLNPAPETQPALPLTHIERLVRPHERLRDWAFDGTVDLALDASHAAKHNENWRVGLQTMLRRDNWRHGLTLDYRRKSQDGVVGTHQYSALYTLDRFVTEKLFIQGRARFGQDYVDDPKTESRLAVGPGYQFWDDEMGAFSLTSLLTHTRYRYRDGANPHFQSLGLSWDYSRYLDGKRWQLFSQGEAYQALSQGSDHSLDATAGLRYSLTQWLSLYAKAGYNKVRNRSQHSSSERTYSVGVSASW